MRTDRILDDIKSKTDIVDLISGYVQLKKAGQNWKGLCPFHTEKTPSFTVSQTKQMFHCFGCSTGGDAIAFIMKHEHLSFNEALAVLAKKAGVTLPDGSIDRKGIQRNEKIRNVLSEASGYFISQVPRAAKASAYMADRGISAESLERFKIGYAPAGWSNLLRHLRSRGYKDQEITEAGLAVSGEKGLYDMFRDRLMFPIMNMSGHVIAFGGRAFDDTPPKYINSPETPVFKKSETLYGLYHAKEDIRCENRVLLTEGYMDVVVCHQFGFRHAVAPLGTSLTPGHIQKIRTMAGSLVLVFDGDTAGKSAAKRALTLIAQQNLKASVLLLPDNEDPDSYLRKFGAGAFAGLLDKAHSMVSFIFRTATGEKLDAVRDALGLIALVSDLLVADELLIELCDISRMNESTLRDELRKMKQSGATRALPGRAADPRKGNSEEFLLLSAVIAAPEKADYVLSRIDIQDIQDMTVASLFRRFAAAQDRRDLSQILTGAEEDEQRLVTRLSVDPGFDPEYIDKNIEDCFVRIQKRKLDKKIRLAERSDDQAQSNALLIEKQKMIKGQGI
ncbi:MAG: DNA primase [Nitrospirae bacterium]|nr:MAG: DNA primase [Nitrospirota bacterium]